MSNIKVDGGRAGSAKQRHVCGGRAVRKADGVECAAPINLVVSEG